MSNPTDPSRPRQGAYRPPPSSSDERLDQQQYRRDPPTRPMRPFPARARSQPPAEPKQRRTKGERKERRRRIRRWVRWTAISLAVLVILTGIDFGSAAGAEYRVAQEMKRQLQLKDDPSVRINGFPFLTQLLGSDYDHIEVEASGVSVGPLSNIGIEADLYHVRADIGDIVRNKLKQVKVDRVEGRVRILDRDLGRVLGLPDLRLQKASDEEVKQAFGSVDVAEKDDDPRAAVRMVADTTADGQEISAVVIALVEIVDNKIRLTATDIRLNDDDRDFSLPDAFKRPLLATFSTEIDPGAIPFSVRPTAVYVEGGTLVGEGTARDVVIDQADIGFGS